MEEWVETKYKIMKEDILLVRQEWEPYWKVPTQGDTTKQGGDNEVAQHTYVEMNLPGNDAEDTDQGNGMEDIPKIDPTNQPPQSLP
jgi:hypothetical protein